MNSRPKTITALGIKWKIDHNNSTRLVPGHVNNNYLPVGRNRDSPVLKWPGTDLEVLIVLQHTLGGAAGSKLVAAIMSPNGLTYLETNGKDLRAAVKKLNKLWAELGLMA